MFAVGDPVAGCDLIGIPGSAAWTEEKLAVNAIPMMLRILFFMAGVDCFLM